MRILAAAAALVIVGASLAGCTSADGASDSGGPEQGGSIEVPGSDGGEAGFPGDTSTGGGTDADEDRAVVTTGTVSITVDSPANAAEDAAAIVETVGGRVDGRTQQAASESFGGRATLTVRIPSEIFTATLERLKRLGDVERIDLRSTDVTRQGRDLDARITGLRTSVDRLIDLLAVADSTDDLLSIETVLSDRQTKLEQLESERAYLTDQVALTTVTLELLSEGIAPADPPDDFWAGLAAGFAGLVSALVAFTVGLGFALPWLVFLGILGVAALLGGRAVLRRRRVAGTNPQTPGPAG